MSGRNEVLETKQLRETIQGKQKLGEVYWRLKTESIDVYSGSPKLDGGQLDLLRKKLDQLQVPVDTATIDNRVGQMTDVVQIKSDISFIKQWLLEIEEFARLPIQDPFNNEERNSAYDKAMSEGELVENIIGLKSHDFANQARRIVATQMKGEYEYALSKLEERAKEPSK